MRKKELYTVLLTALAFLFIFTSPPAMAEEAVLFRFDNQNRFKITLRENLSKKVNGRYQGHVYREERAVLYPDPYSIEYGGQYFVLEETLRNLMASARKIDAVNEVQFSLEPTGEYVSTNRLTIPRVRNFPVFPAGPISPGTVWQDYGFRTVDPLRNGKKTNIEFYCQYTFKGRDVYLERDVYLIEAQYALRYRQGQDRYGDPELRTVSGKHVVSIILSTDTFTPVFMRDTLNDAFVYADGRQVEYQGFSLTWFDDITSLNKREIIEDLQEQLIAATEQTAPDSSEPDATGPTSSDIEAAITEATNENAEDTKIEEVPEGLKISLQNLHFIPDKAELLPGDLPRLEAIATALKKVPERTIMVVGHTAAVGSTSFLFDLSVRRAKKIVEELSKRGLPEERFIYEGRGATEPIGDNNTEDGRKLNRRVELIILED